MQGDCLGRSPLHVTAGTDTILLVIKLSTALYSQVCNGKDENGSGSDDDEKEENGTEKGEALDLLTSAAFLFKHSRRNLM